MPRHTVSKTLDLLLEAHQHHLGYLPDGIPLSVTEMAELSAELGLKPLVMPKTYKGLVLRICLEPNLANLRDIEDLRGFLRSAQIKESNGKAE